MSFYKTLLTQGQPITRDLDIGIHMKPLVPAAKPPEDPPPCVLPLIITISDEYLAVTTPAPWTNVHTVTLENRVAGETEFPFAIVQLDVDGSPMNFGPLVFSNDVWLDPSYALTGTLNIPAGVTTFTITVDDIDEILMWVKYQVQIRNVYGSGTFQTF